MTVEPRYLDISDNAELRALAEEVQRTGTPRVLRADGRDIAVLSPAGAKPALADPHDIWAGYDPKKARAALAASRGIFAGIDTEQLKRDIKEARGQKERDDRSDQR